MYRNLTHPSASWLGTGSAPRTVETGVFHLPGIELVFQESDIRRPTDWRHQNDRHAFIVHLGGNMSRLETELDGHGGSFGTAVPGEVWSIPADCRYASHAAGDSISYVMAYLSPGLDVLGPEAASPCEIRAVAGLPDPFLHQALRTLLTNLSDHSDLAEMFRQSLAQSIAFHLRQAYAHDASSSVVRASDQPRLSDKIIRMLYRYVDEHLGERLSMELLADVAGLPTRQFLNAFRQSLGTTPWQFILAQRIREARRLLAHSSLDITTIALRVGFSSHSHLTTAFRRRVGVTPRTFRRDTSS